MLFWNSLAFLMIQRILAIWSQYPVIHQNYYLSCPLSLWLLLLQSRRADLTCDYVFTCQDFQVIVFPKTSAASRNWFSVYSAFCCYCCNNRYDGFQILYMLRLTEICEIYFLSNLSTFQGWDIFLSSEQTCLPRLFLNPLFLASFPPTLPHHLKLHSLQSCKTEDIQFL